MPKRGLSEVTPSAARLTESLRDIGYDFQSAVADIVDNSIAAGATTVEVLIEFDGADSRVLIADDGSGMSANGLLEALRYGSRRDYGVGDLGRYGLGLKTASLSQCRSVTVATRRASVSPRIWVRRLDLDLISHWDEWLVIDPGPGLAVSRAKEWLACSPGTVVIWEKLDRILPDKRPEGGWAKRRIEALIQKTSEHLGIVFHRFLENTAGRTLAISVNGEKVIPWNPFAPDEPSTVELPPHRFEVVVGDVIGAVRLHRFVLPPRSSFESSGAWERLSGPLKWNRQQGLYIYRAERLVQWGGWSGLRSIDEHTKLARAALHFDADLDPAFNINVAKIRVTVPPQLRQMLERPIHELCLHAEDAYRKASQLRGNGPQHVNAASTTPPGKTPLGTGRTTSAGLALRSAAMQAGEYEAFRRIMNALNETAPEVAAFLGLDSPPPH